jgi:hypothetical protein
LLYASAVDTAPTIDLSGSSRNIQLQEQGQEQDVSTRDDYIANSTAYITNPPQRSITLQGRDTTPNSSRTWNNVDVSNAGRVAIYPLGSSPTGLPYEIGNVVCTNSSWTGPADNAAEYEIQWRVNGAWSTGTT